MGYRTSFNGPAVPYRPRLCTVAGIRRILYGVQGILISEAKDFSLTGPGL